MLWDIFCKVIDNHGDLGVTWRLSADLAARGQQVRLWVDDPSTLSWMAPEGCAGLQVVRWTATPPQASPGEAVVEAFGCDPHPDFVAAMATRARQTGRQPAWFNLEYLSAEGYVERFHGLASPVMSGPGQGLVKRFFYPGFTARTGGLIREQDLSQRQRAFDRDEWLARMVARTGKGGRGNELRGRERLVSLFCYEPPALGGLLVQLARQAQPTRLLVTAGRARAAVESVLPKLPAADRPAITLLPLLTQPEFDELLWACDLNFVRGEDSLVRALWAGRPFVWQIYPQQDQAHYVKLRSFLDWLDAPASLRAAHEAWNGLRDELPPVFDPSWRACIEAARQSLLMQADLATQLLRAADWPASWSDETR